MKTKQMSYGLTWLFLTLLMIGMSWSAAVSPSDETVLASSDGDTTSSTEVDIVALDASEMNTNDLIFEEEASEDIETKPMDDMSQFVKSDLTDEQIQLEAEYALMDELDAELDLINGVTSTAVGDAVIEEVPEGFTVPEAPVDEETYDVTSGRATCSGTTTLGAMTFEDFEGGSTSSSSLAPTDMSGKTKGTTWRRNTQRGSNWGTPSSGTGPSSAYQGQRFAFTEGSGTGSGWAEIQFDTCLDTSSLASMNVEFRWHMHGDYSGWQQVCSWWGGCSWQFRQGMQNFNFDVSDNGGQSWTNKWNKYNRQGNFWGNSGVINLDSYVGNTNFALRFNALMSSSSFRDDYAIDNVQIYGLLAAGDMDGDGVIDTNDLCDGSPASEPTHPPNIEVGADGCPLDDDSDGIWDIFDQCPYTPAALGATVDSVGCPAGLALPWTDNFEGRGDILENNVDGWFSLDQSGDGVNDWDWYTSSTYCSNDPQGSHCAANMWDYDTGKRWLVSPRVAIPLDVSFGIEATWEEYTAFTNWYRGSSGRATNAQSLYISDKACDPTMGDFVHLWTATQADVSASRSTKTFDISAYAGKDVCLAWVYDQYDGTSWYVDSFMVEQKTSPDDDDNDGVWDFDADGNQIDLCLNSAAGAAVTAMDLTDLNNDGAVNYADYELFSGSMPATVGCQEALPLPFSEDFETWMGGGGATEYDGPAGWYNWNTNDAGGNGWSRSTANSPNSPTMSAQRVYSASSFGVVRSNFVMPMLDLTTAVDDNGATVTPDIAYMTWMERGIFSSYYSNTWAGYNGIQVAIVDRVANPLQECDPSDPGLTWEYIDNDDAGDTNGDGVVDSSDNKLLGRHDGETGYPRSPTNLFGSAWQANRIELTPYLGNEICVNMIYEGRWAHNWYIDELEVDFEVIPPDVEAPYIADEWQTTTLGYPFKGFVPYQGNTYRADARTMMIVLSDDASGVDNGQGVSSAAQAPILHFQITAPNPADGSPVVIFPDATTQAGLAQAGIQDTSWMPSPSTDASEGYSECSQDVPIPFTQTHTCLFYASLPPLPAVGTTMHYKWSWQDIGWKGANGLTHPITGALLPDLGGGPNVGGTPTYSYTLTSSDFAADDAMKMQMLVEGVNSAADTPAAAGQLTAALTQGIASTPQYYDVQMTYYEDTQETTWEYDMSNCIAYDMAAQGLPGYNTYPGCIYGDVTRALQGQAPNGAQALLGAVYHPGSCDNTITGASTADSEASCDMYMWLVDFDASQWGMGGTVTGCYNLGSHAFVPANAGPLGNQAACEAFVWTATDTYEQFTKPDNAGFPVFVPGSVTNWLSYYDASMDAMGVVALGSPDGSAGPNTGISEKPSEYATTYSSFDVVDAAKPGDGYVMMDIPTGITEDFSGEFGSNTFEQNSADGFNKMCVTSNSIFGYMDTDLTPIQMTAYSPCRSMAALGDFGFNGYGWAVAEGHFAYSQDASYEASDNLWSISVEVNHIVPQKIQDFAPGSVFVERADGAAVNAWDFAMTEDTADGDSTLSYDLGLMRPVNDGLWWDIQRGSDAGSCQYLDFFSGAGFTSDDLTFTLIEDAATDAPNAQSNSEIDWLQNGGIHQIQQQADGACNVDVMLREGPVRIHDTQSVRLAINNVAEERPDYQFDLTQPTPFDFSNVMNVLPNTVIPVSVHVTNQGDDPALYDHDHELVVRFYADDLVGADCAGMSSGTMATAGDDGVTGTSDDGEVAVNECAFSERTIKNPPAVGDTVRVDSEILIGAGTQTVRAHVDVMTCFDDPCLDGPMAVPASLDHTGAATAQATYITSDTGMNDVSYNPRNANLEDKDWSNNVADSAAAGIDLPNRVGLNVANSVPSFAPSLVAVGVVGLFVGVLINSSRREEDEEVLMEEDDTAVSPVIATILMVAITVVLSGIIYVWASQLANTSAKGTPMFTFDAQHYDAGYWEITVLDSSDMELATQAVYVQVEWTVSDGPNAGEYVFEKTTLANNQGGYGFAPSNSESFITFLDSIDCTEDCTTMYGKDDNIRISTTDPNGYTIDSAIVTVSYEISSENYVLRTFTATGGSSPSIK